MNKFLINASALTVMALSRLSLPVMAQGKAVEPSPIGTIPGEGGVSAIISAITTVIGWMLALAGALAVAYLIYGGIQYITGGAGGAENAKKTIINAVVGIVIIVLSYVIVSAVMNFLGAK